MIQRVVLVRLEESFRTDAYVDVYLEPMMEKIRAWNFEL